MVAMTPLGYDSYSIRAFRWKAIELIDYAARLGLDTVQISGLDEYESLDEAHLRKVKDHADRNGIAVDAGIGCICPTTKSYNPRNGKPEEYLLRGARVARAVGSKSMRCFVGSPAERSGALPMEAHIESTVKVLRAARVQLQDLGVKAAIENHGDFTAREMKTLIEQAGSDVAGVCYDTGNPMNVLEDPMLTLEVLAPYIATSHFRDSALFEHPRGCAFQWVALGDGSVGIEKVAARFAELCPGRTMQLEIITGRPPTVLPYLEDEFWKAFPNLPAEDFARFVKLVKSGRPYYGPMVIGGAGRQPEAIEAALKEQQRIDLERSLEYARSRMGAGVRKRA
jgi:sugar phosphate isomerase/epimerase